MITTIKDKLTTDTQWILYNSATHKFYKIENKEGYVTRAIPVDRYEDATWYPYLHLDRCSLSTVKELMKESFNASAKLITVSEAISLREPSYLAFGYVDAETRKIVACRKINDTFVYNSDSDILTHLHENDILSLCYLSKNNAEAIYSLFESDDTLRSNLWNTEVITNNYFGYCGRAFKFIYGGIIITGEMKDKYSAILDNSVHANINKRTGKISYVLDFKTKYPDQSVFIEAFAERIRKGLPLGNEKPPENNDDVLDEVNE